VKVRRRTERESVTGLARLDSRTKNLARRIARGEIAIIDHVDLDRVAAESLVAAGVGAVVNASPSISGRYPNSGPLRLAEAGIPLLDDVGSGVMNAVHEGEFLEINGCELRRDGEVIAKGSLLSLPEIEERMEVARLGIGVELRRFAHNTLQYIDREADLTFEPLDLPELRTKVRGRHALVVVRGHDYKHDLRALRPYIKEFRPVLIAVDGGADALLEFGLKPDIITGDFDSLSEAAMQCGAELIAHERNDGYSPAREMLTERGLPFETLVAPGMSEDVAMLLAYEAGAALIVAVGTHATMVEFLDKGRSGMASTFLTRLRLGPVLVDAKGVSRLYQGRARRLDLVLLVGSALFAMVAMFIVAESFGYRVFFHGFHLWFSDRWRSVREWFERR
jgi:uncharacterized membrane-anchored protein